MSINKSRPIGFFDSGVGGISIFNQVATQLPKENFLYLADSLNAPYGIRSQKQIIDLSIKNTDLLVKKGCKMIVVACNTATTNAIDTLRSKYDIPFVGIEPAVKPAIVLSKVNRIGVLATKGTLSSELFANSNHHALLNHTNIVEVEGKGLVERIESNTFNDPTFITDLKILTQEFIDKKVDYVVLGCTHYSFLKPILFDLLPKNINIIDAIEPVSRQIKKILTDRSLENDINNFNSHQFFTNKHPEIIKHFVCQKLKNKIKAEFLNF
jgi:glutamate racemase